jgi:hypothetical protein
MPERGVGVVVLANSGGAGMLADIVATYAYDRVLAKPCAAARPAPPAADAGG